MKKIIEKILELVTADYSSKQLVLSCCFFGLLVFPAIQYSLQVLPKISLVDTPMQKKFPVLSIQSLLTTEFQQKFEKWLMHNNGLFGWMIKTGNSINYQLFDIGSSRYSSRTIVGAQKALFDKIYLNDFNGKYLTKVPDPEAHAKLIKNVQEGMNQQDKAFLLVIHPNKARLNPNWVKESQKVGEPSPGYLARLRPYLDREKINYLVVSDFFNPKIQYFVKSGAHLNNYGKCFSAKLVNDRLRTLIPNADLPQFECELNNRLVSPQDEDLDLANLLNIWDYTPSLEPVPDFKLIVKNTPKERLKALFAGTSYCFGMLSLFDQVEAFRAVDFLFYNKTHYYSRKKYTPNVQKGKSAFSKKLHRPQFILNHDLLVLESTDARLHQLGFGLLDSFKIN